MDKSIKWPSENLEYPNRSIPNMLDPILKKNQDELEQLMMKQQKPNETLVSMGRGNSILLDKTEVNQKTIATMGLNRCLATGIYLKYKNGNQAASITHYAPTQFEKIKNAAKLRDFITNFCEGKEIEKIHTIISIPAANEDLNMAQNEYNLNYLKAILEYWLDKYSISATNHHTFYDTSKLESKKPNERDVEIILSHDGRSYFSTQNPDRTIFFE